MKKNQEQTLISKSSAKILEIEWARSIAANGEILSYISMHIFKSLSRTLILFC